jgi:hypothetical protein
MSFNVGGVNIDFPPGTIAAYLGTSDPPGWVIMDGVARNDNADGKYTRVALLSIGSGGSGTTSYTPPNYKGAFLRGNGANGTNVSAALGGFQADDYQSHNHSITDPGHNHTTDPSYLIWNTDDYATANGGNGGGNGRNEINSNTTGVTIDTVVRNSAGTVIGSTETRPYNFSVNWILKL